MLFNSTLFLKFFAAFLLLYWIVRKNLNARNWLIVAASYVFYAAWDWRFLSLLIVSSFVDYFVGLGLNRTEHPARRRLLLTTSMVVNLGILGFFKYYGFFVDSFRELLASMNVSLNLKTLEIVLPVGISFYTFQTMSYTIDVYQGKIRATNKLADFLAYVAFFPQLVAGPIERATHLLPQFGQTREITAAMLREGIWLCIWGMFKKVVIADNLAPLVEMAFESDTPGAPLILLGTLAFAFQIYGDFSGYSDIARGTAKILGFDLMINFNLPYLAASIREFWGRWHISLSTWLRDYLYISLGGNRGAMVATCFNLMITMLLGGLWHGANWTFILWGAWHGFGLVLHRIWMLRHPDYSERWTWWGWLLTGLFVLYGWLLFRAESFAHIVSLNRAFLEWKLPTWFGSYLLNLLIFMLPLILLQAWQWRSKDLLAPLRLRDWQLGALEAVFLVGIIMYWAKEKVPFIYFQF